MENLLGIQPYTFDQYILKMKMCETEEILQNANANLLLN